MLENLAKNYTMGWDMEKIQRGFTLIELMVVIAVIGVLATLAIAAYQDYLIRTQVSEAFALASGSKSAVGEYYADRGEWPTTNKLAGQSLPSSINGLYVESVRISQGSGPNSRILVTMRSGDGVATNKKIWGGQLLMSGTNTGGAFKWDCTSVGAPGDFTYIEDKYMPSVCR